MIPVTNHSSDWFDFSEAQLVEYFKGEKANFRKYIIDSIKHTITHSPDNKLGAFIDFEGKQKTLPISRVSLRLLTDWAISQRLTADVVLWHTNARRLAFTPNHLIF